jgi:FKBP-type peptidyl-prolyl cis-trans isomerase 2
MVKTGDNVTVHYVGKFDDETVFDSSHDRGEPIAFQIGSGQMIPGFESAVAGMHAGEVKNIRLDPADAYGEVNPEAVGEVNKSNFPEDFEFVTGATVYGQAQDGSPIIAKILSEGEDTVTMDMNHPLAGKHLNFEITLVDLEAATA